MRLRLALACVLAATSLVATAPAAQAAPCSTATRTISGTLLGEDGRFVDAMLGFDLIRKVDGKRLHLDGREGSPNYGCPGYHGYGQILRVNRDVSAYGSTTTGTKYWSVKIPAIVNEVIVEVYPRAAGTGPVDDRRYSGALRWKVPIPYGKRITIELPLVCRAGGKTGYIAGKVTKNGSPVKVDFVGGWSMAPDNNTASPILGFRVGDGYDNGVYKIRNLAGNQYYTVYWIENGVRKQRYNIWVAACKGTPISIAY